MIIRNLCWFKLIQFLRWPTRGFRRNTFFSRGFRGRSPKAHNRQLWRIILSYKHIWMECVGVIYHGKCNYYVLINCIRHIRHCLRGEFTHNYFKTFNSLLIWDKNLGSHTSCPVAKLLLNSSWYVSVLVKTILGYDLYRASHPSNLKHGGFHHLQ